VAVTEALMDTMMAGTLCQCDKPESAKAFGTALKLMWCHGFHDTIQLATHCASGNLLHCIAELSSVLPPWRVASSLESAIAHLTGCVQQQSLAMTRGTRLADAASLLRQACCWLIGIWPPNCSATAAAVAANIGKKLYLYAWCGVTMPTCPTHHPKTMTTLQRLTWVMGCL